MDYLEAHRSLAHTLILVFRTNIHMNQLGCRYLIGPKRQNTKKYALYTNIYSIGNGLNLMNNSTAIIERWMFLLFKNIFLQRQKTDFCLL